MPNIPFLLSKVGNIHPATRAKAIEIINEAAKHGHEIWFVWGMGGGKEHGSGNALDLMVRNHAAGEWVRGYIWANRARLRLRHVIWAQTITSTVKFPGVRRKMEDRGNSTQNHFDHNHVWFLDSNAYVPPAAPKPSKPSKPSPSSSGTLSRGSTGTRVAFLQRELNRVFPAYSRLKVDSKFGPATESVVKEFQRRSHIERDGRVGPITKAHLARNGIVL